MALNSMAVKLLCSAEDSEDARRFERTLCRVPTVSKVELTKREPACQKKRRRAKSSAPKPAGRWSDVARSTPPALKYLKARRP
jgi:hypothetical protein